MNLAKDLDFLLQRPSTLSFGAIVRVIGNLYPDALNRDAYEAIKHKLDDWPTTIPRRAPESWTMQPDSRLDLCTSFDFRDDVIPKAHIEALLSNGFLDHARCLSFTNTGIDFTLFHGDFANLTSLKATHENLNDADCRDLSSKLGALLDELDLSSNRIEKPHSIGLAALEGLRTVVLSHNPLSEDSIGEWLGGRSLTRLDNVFIDGCGLTDDLADVLPRESSLLLSMLSIRNNRLSYETLSGLIELLLDEHACIDVSGNNLKQADIEELHATYQGLIDLEQL